MAALFGKVKVVIAWRDFKEQFMMLTASKVPFEGSVFLRIEVG